jgi:calcineurin-like phosphoesterase family protein
MRYWFTADEHYGLTSIIKNCNRPFKDVREMNEVLVQNHNDVVKDAVVHAGDFAWANNRDDARKYFRRLSGTHIFLKGSHDYWLKPRTSYQIWEQDFGNGIYDGSMAP